MDDFLDKEIADRMKFIIGLVTIIDDILDSMNLDEVKDRAMRCSLLLTIQKILMESHQRHKQTEEKDSMQHISEILNNIDFDKYKLGDDE